MGHAGRLQTPQFALLQREQCFAIGCAERARTSRATRMACSSLVMSPSLPGTVGTPAACSIENGSLWAQSNI